MSQDDLARAGEVAFMLVLGTDPVYLHIMAALRVHAAQKGRECELAFLDQCEKLRRWALEQVAQPMQPTEQVPQVFRDAFSGLEG